MSNRRPLLIPLILASGVVGCAIFALGCFAGLLTYGGHP